MKSGLAVRVAVAGVLSWALAPIAAPAAPVAAQVAEAVLQDRDGVAATIRADRLAGLYELDDGRLVYVLDLRDQLQGRPVLSMVEYGSGRVRALYPAGDGGESDARDRAGAVAGHDADHAAATAWFVAGDAWFSRDSTEYRVRFHERGGQAGGLTWREAGATIRGHRVPLVEREVAVSSGDVTLTGTLVLPPGEGPFPAVVMVPGSGPLTRRAPRYVGDLLAYHGVAVLATDKRGTGGSTGHWNGLSHMDWAGDVEAQLDVLISRSEIDADRIGLFAASEGGFVAPVVAARRPDVDFVVCRVCSATPHPVVIRDMTLGRLRRQGLSEEDVAAAGRLLEWMARYALDGTGYDRLVAHARSGQGTAWRRVLPLPEIPAPDAAYWERYRGVLEVDPGRRYRGFDGPLLVVLGEDDNRVLLDRHRPVFEAMGEDGVDLDLWVIDDASHGLLLTNSDGAVHSYPPGLHHRIAEWVAQAARATTPAP